MIRDISLSKSSKADCDATTATEGSFHCFSLLAKSTKSSSEVARTAFRHFCLLIGLSPLRYLVRATHPASLALSAEPSRLPTVPMTAVVMAALSSRDRAPDSESRRIESAASAKRERVSSGLFGSRYV